MYQTPSCGMSMCCFHMSNPKQGPHLGSGLGKGAVEVSGCLCCRVYALHVSDRPLSSVICSTSEAILRLRSYTEQAIYAWCSLATLAYSMTTPALSIQQTQDGEAGLSLTHPEQQPVRRSCRKHSAQAHCSLHLPSTAFCRGTAHTARWAMYAFVVTY